MAPCTSGQSALNMLRCTIFVLQLYGLLVACCCTVAHRNPYDGVPVPIDCSQKWNSTECETKEVEVEEETDQTVTRSDETGEAKGGGNGEQEVTGRKKKGKGYGQMLMYFLGASKLTMLYVIMNGIAAIAGKALVVAKVALAIAAAIALKKALEHKESVSYEIIKHPLHSYEHTHSSSVDFDHHGGFGENEFNYRKRRRI